AFDIGFDVLRRDQTHRVAERAQFACPVVRAATGFNGDFGGEKLLEERQQLPTAEVGPQDRPVPGVDTMDGEDGFGRVDGDAFILGHGRLRSWWVTAPILALGAVGPSTPTVRDHSFALPGLRSM